MACVENVPPANAESEMEEGEIVDEYDDISSDEELLLRQRLHVLETYNNVLERKKANDFSIAPGDKERCDLSQVFSEISNSEFEDDVYAIPHVFRNVKNKHFKTHYKHKKRKEQISFKSSGKTKNSKKKVSRKKKMDIKMINEASEESDDEYRNKRRKLANAVSFNKNKNKNDTSSLSARLKKMLNGPQAGLPMKNNCVENKQTDIDVNLESVTVTSSLPDNIFQNKIHEKDDQNVIPNDITAEVTNPSKISESIDLCNDDDVQIIDGNEHTQDTVDSATVEKFNEAHNKENQSDSDEDLELLRQHALKTKSSKSKAPQMETTEETDNKLPNLPEDEDSYTAELRLICLKSAYLKKAFEIKRKQKLKKRLSQSSILQDAHITELNFLPNRVDSQDNTDIESVDMEIGSDGDEKLKEASSDCNINNNLIGNAEVMSNQNISTEKSKVDELEEDEDLLRAKLLTSLSKNLPNLIDSKILDSIQETPCADIPLPAEKNKQAVNAPQPKKFIIQLGESDSEGENEVTQNLTKMHMKQQQTNFEQELDLLLKCTRMEVERQLQPKTQESTVKTPEKFVPKSVKHLPKSEQIEYKNLVKRMAELEKIKQTRQISMNAANKTIQLKDTLKPRNVSVEAKYSLDNNIDGKIAESRKIIAEESAKMNRLKEEAIKLSQKHNIVSTELKNIVTAIATNKKQQRSVQMRLSKIRVQHQMLLKSLTFTHSQMNGFLPSINRPSHKIITMTKLQKENNPTKEEHKNAQILKSMKISVVNDLKEDIPNPRLSVHVDISNNKKVVKVPKSPVKENNIDNCFKKPDINTNGNSCTYDQYDITAINQPVVEKGGGERRNSRENECQIRKEETKRKTETDDYISPLEALHTTNWEEDPNAVLCPFEVGGNCKDPDCKYLHPKIPSLQ